ncbi:phosphatidate cytidylyltransferase [Alteromonas sp. McT4-15]|jgi:phosphatidate cytidylyltransferase|uniref:phosphatidate cytidylyltransferase n=1 Tax=unclassified Alteromonas TaxID=2614992 RepID=UPI0012E5885D|nr:MULTISPECIES: phosphatidate cytidylyltransferase [unclassified Alteromonas]GFD88169.1 phosphatidate cytidylyltransferase [Tenacibaculum sp. KUL152]MCB4435398.1 phosphatidate cytidylyltransferase [Alteromonas sp. McT4-15]WDT87091.1 phosphatidate cytidylyltransferase [Alteromonas sp. 009811495]BCO18087.1 phosphatidate cytidylyltransferase [Alteromonas sp. KC3]BCO22049.1 phosphatidate cytidylyltransferase [Alteromonas sp. KC14]
MLKQRIITALILAPLALYAILFLPIFWFEIAIAGVVGIGAYEWANMSGVCERPKKLMYLVGAFSICILLSLIVDADSIWHQGQLHGLYRGILTISVFWWIASLFMVLAYPKHTGFWRESKGVRTLFGALTLIPTWVAVIALKTSLYDVDHHYGTSLIFYVLGIVWAADIGAFFVGVKFGRHKLRPNVSPGKSLEGLLGGIAASFAIIAFAALHYQVEPSRIWLHFVVGCITVAVSALGDLNESMLKRCAGIKDSGKILPGHGGVLDRIDSLTAAFPVFAFCYVTWMA